MDIILDDNCLFCGIISGKVPSDKVYEDDRTLAFRDINPQAPTHILVVPKNHIKSVAELTGDNSRWAAWCLETAAEVARRENLSGGFRVISNCGADAGQTVPHLHFHILAGTNMGEKLM